MYRTQGFTLIELGITLAVVGVLLSMAVPAYVRTVAENRAFAFVEALKVDVQWARTQAMAHNTYATINFTDSDCSTWTVSVNSSVVAGRGMSSTELAKNYPGISCSFTGSVPTFNGEGMALRKDGFLPSYYLPTAICNLPTAGSECSRGNRVPVRASTFSDYDKFVAIVTSSSTDRKWQMEVGGAGDLRMVAQ